MHLVTHRRLLVVVAVVAAAALGGLLALWPGDVDVDGEETTAQTTELVDATLLDVEEAEGGEDTSLQMTPGATNVELTARLEVTGEIVRFPMVDETGEMFAAGQGVKLAAIEESGQETTYAVSDYQRDRPLLLLAALFVGAVVVFSRWQGVRALVGVGLTLVVIVGFVVPAILDGSSPVLVALVGAVTIMIVTLYASHGYSAKTTAAVVGTGVALGLTGLLAAAFVSAASLTGLASEDARLANVTVGGLSLQGLLLAGIIIGGLGVLDDVTMSQSSTVFELHRANPAARFAELVRGALNVGRDHIAATVNTLFLAYGGAALPLLILFATGDEGLGSIVTSEIVAVEVVRTLVGSLGLVAAVPITTTLAAALVVSEGEPDRRREAPKAWASESDRGRRRAGHSAQDSAPEPILGDEDEDENEDNEDWEARLRAAYRLLEDDSGTGTEERKRGMGDHDRSARGEST